MPPAYWRSRDPPRPPSARNTPVRRGVCCPDVATLWSPPFVEQTKAKGDGRHHDHRSAAEGVALMAAVKKSPPKKKSTSTKKVAPAKSKAGVAKKKAAPARKASPVKKK